MINKIYRATEYTDYTPFLSTVCGITQFVIKKFFLVDLDKKTINNYAYFRYINAKTYKRILIICVPIIGNLYVAIYDLFNKKANHEAKVLYEIKNNNFSLLDESLKKNEQFMAQAIESNYNAYKFVDSNLKNSEEIVRAAFVGKSNISLDVSDKDALKTFKNNKGIFSSIVQYNGMALEHADQELKNERDLVLTAVKQNLNAIVFASDKLKEDEDFIRECFDNKFQTLKDLNDAVKEDFILMKTIVSIDDMAIEHIPVKTPDFIELYETAVTKNSLNFDRFKKFYHMSTLLGRMQEKGFKLKSEAIYKENPIDGFELCDMVDCFNFAKLLAQEGKYFEKYLLIARKAVENNFKILESLYDIIMYDEFLFQDKLLTYIDLAKTVISKNDEAIQYVSKNFINNHPNENRALLDFLKNRKVIKTLKLTLKQV